jgi:hypothetical protein
MTKVITVFGNFGRGAQKKWHRISQRDWDENCSQFATLCFVGWLNITDVSEYHVALKFKQIASYSYLTWSQLWRNSMLRQRIESVGVYTKYVYIINAS